VLTRRCDAPSQESLELKDKVLQLERILLQTIAFDLTVEHPYKYILNFVKKINGTLSSLPARTHTRARTQLSGPARSGSSALGSLT
jgi:hypothetical protein